MRIGEPIREPEWIAPSVPLPIEEPTPGPEIPVEVPEEEPAYPVEVPETVPVGTPMTPGTRRIGFGPDITNSVMSVPLGLNWKKMDELGYLHQEGPRVQYLPKRRSEPEITRL
jgi:hypothetical protein